jgi:hypothetical protein
MSALPYLAPLTVIKYDLINNGEVLSIATGLWLNPKFCIQTILKTP